MELETLEFKNPIDRFFKKIKYLWNRIWESKLYTFIFLVVILISIMAYVMAYPAYLNGFMHIASDDVLQYYPYVGGFFEKLKAGEVSLYDKDFLLGASSFSSLYYVPLDIFTLIAFLFSFIIPGEMAYAGMNLFRVIVGSLIFYYVLSRKMSNKVSFFAALILFIGGMTEAYYIFPVYLGIITYAPLAMLLVDYVIEKKGIFYLLIPLYIIIVVLYDFYISYMLIAFLCIYFVIKNHIENEFSFFGKNTIFRNGKFWISFIKFMAMVLLGVMIMLFILLPSALYILNESNRSNSLVITESKWFFSKTVDGEYQISWRHYFTQLINIFIPNEPHRLCLAEPGDYVREHATLYLTSGGLIYFIYFFFIIKRRENRMKFWVILFNILLLIPIFSIIMGLNTTPYIRWFFIPYMLNIYAMAMGMSDMEFKIGNKSILKLFPMIILILGVSLLTYVLITDPEIFIHYHKSDEVFYPLLIIGIVFNSIYVLLLLAAFILHLLKINTKAFILTTEIIIFLEIIFAGVLIFVNTGNTNNYYMYAKNKLYSEKEHFKELGYDPKSGYRINAYTPYGRDTLNASLLAGVNFGRFFQSFYPTSFNTVNSNIYMDYSTGWGRVFNFGYTFINSPLFNVKYIVSSDLIDLPEKYYNKTTYDSEDYYILKDDIPFIVYDKGYTSPTSLGAFERQASLLEYAYVSLPSKSLEELKKNKDNYGVSLYSSYDTIIDSNFEIVKTKDVSSSISKYYKKVYINKNVIEYDEYRVYDLTTQNVKKTFEGMDAIYAWSNSSKIREEASLYMYIREKNPDNPEEVDTMDNYGILHQMHYNEAFLGDYTPTQLLVQFKDEENTEGIDLYAYSFKLYDDFIERQNEYKEKYFSLDGNKMTIKCKMPDDNKTRIIKTGYAYSEDWNIINNKYELVAIDGSFLGIIIPENEKNIDITLEFKPKGYYDGVKLSLAGVSIYLTINIISLGVIIIRRRNQE